MPAAVIAQTPALTTASKIAKGTPPLELLITRKVGNTHTFAKIIQYDGGGKGASM
jgi:hypothetical protein